MSSSCFKEIVILLVADIQVSKYVSHGYSLSDLRFNRKEISDLPCSRITNGFSQGTQGVQTQVFPSLCPSLVFCHACPILANVIFIRSNAVKMQVLSIQLCQFVSETKREERKKKKISAEI